MSAYFKRLPRRLKLDSCPCDRRPQVWRRCAFSAHQKVLQQLQPRLTCSCSFRWSRLQPLAGCQSGGRRKAAQTCDYCPCEASHQLQQLNIAVRESRGANPLENGCPGVGRWSGRKGSAIAPAGTRRGSVVGSRRGHHGSLSFQFTSIQFYL